MLPPFRPDGSLPVGIHWTTWPEFETRFGANNYRKQLMSGLKEALLSLQTAGCIAAYVDGSFVTSEEVPGDFDGCWDPNGVDLEQLDPLLTDDYDLRNGRRKQKMKFRGEFMPNIEGVPLPILEFFQFTRDGVRKGIVALRLGNLV